MGQKVVRRASMRVVPVVLVLVVRALVVRGMALLPLGRDVLHAAAMVRRMVVRVSVA
ncbi:MAG: hypothetical protein K8T25_14680 [Planctomycetia bacterium]|nr:hypothetical protein [Planctomycetia bacterium]